MKMNNDMYQALVSVIADMERDGMRTDNQIEQYIELCDERNAAQEEGCS